MDVESGFYIKRPADEKVRSEIKKPRGLVTVRGPRQTGKTSLILQAYINSGGPDVTLRPVFVDLQILPHEHLESLGAVWKAIAIKMDEQLRLEGWDPESWDLKGSYDRNITRFLDRFVFEGNDAPVLICLDEVDRVFSSPIKTEFFSSVRAFWTRGAFDAAWKKIRWVLSTSSEPSFFIDDLNQSPFNIGLRVELNAFTPDETEAFARRHGLSLAGPMIERIMKYVGGRPYLVHLLLYQMARHPGGTERLFDSHGAGDGIFLEHLNRYLQQFQKEPKLAAAMKRVIAGDGCEDVETADRLEAAGLTRRDKDGNEICLCDLYQDFFGKEL
ncbi:MAG: hypothetical protein GY859_28240 [Desulfobacterales bacterium]|nr:hypothetical protein [Desulfobacterales bacterium]